MNDLSKKERIQNFKSSPFTIPTNEDGTIIMPIEVNRRQDLQNKIDYIEALIKAVGAQGIDCGHVHAASNPCHNQTISDEESQISPEYPSLEIEEAEDCAIQTGKAGEIITSIAGALAIGPVIDFLLTQIVPTVSEFPWFKPNDSLKVSPAILLISLMLVSPAVYGAPHCHAKLEIASRTRNNFIILAKYAQKLLKWGLKNNLSINDSQLALPKIKIGKQEITIDAFKLIPPSAAAPLSFKQKFQIFGDVEQHYNEYVGLTIIAILRNIHNPIAQFILISACLLIAGIACQPEVTTCINTLALMNELKNGNIINNPNATNTANWKTKFSAIAKTPAILYASLLSFQQICFGNFYAGLALAILATKGNIITQYFINAHTEALGESQSNATQLHVVDKRKSWQKLTLFGKELVVSRAFGTGNERSEPITLTIIALVAITGGRLSATEQAALALSLCLAGTVTAYSEARNAADHTSRVRFFNTTPLPIEEGLHAKLLPGVTANSSTD